MTRSFEVVRMPYQDSEPVGEPMIASWEARRGVRLPEDYRRFMLATNGGALRPYAFEVSDPRIPERWHALTCLYDWRAVLEESQESVPVHLRNPPPEQLVLGGTESELFILLSLSRSNFGEVSVWPKNLFETWGDGMNTFVVPLTRSFSGFLDLLQDHDEVYQGYWSTHDAEGRTAQRVSI
jgi:hypothetical protein